MQLSGKHTVQAAPSVIWKMLMDTEVLARIVPGISRLEKTGENSYKSILDIKLGPVNSSFTGNLQMEDISPEQGFALRVQQNSRIGNVNASIKIDLLPLGENQTDIRFDGQAKMTGLLASMGQRVMSGVSNTLSKQFFANLEAELQKQ